MPAAPAAVAAAKTTDATDVVPVNTGKKKKLILIGAAVAVLLTVAGGAATFVFKKRAAAAAAATETDGEDGAPVEVAAVKTVKANVKSAPTFVPLDPFTVNLADRDSERYALVGITLELADPKAADLLKAYMPAIRNNILLALGGKTASQLMERDGKLRLAAEIRREALRPLGYEIDAPAPAASGAAPKKVPTADDDEEPTPIRAVHFSNFIIQ